MPQPEIPNAFADPLVSPYRSEETATAPDDGEMKLGRQLMDLERASRIALLIVHLAVIVVLMGLLCLTGSIKTEPPARASEAFSPRSSIARQSFPILARGADPNQRVQSSSR